LATIHTPRHHLKFHRGVAKDETWENRSSEEWVATQKGGKLLWCKALDVSLM
jgi:hypothetical protein